MIRMLRKNTHMAIPQHRMSSIEKLSIKKMRNRMQKY